MAPRILWSESSVAAARRTGSKAMAWSSGLSFKLSPDLGVVQLVDEVQTMRDVLIPSMEQVMAAPAKRHHVQHGVSRPVRLAYWVVVRI